VGDFGGFSHSPFPAEILTFHCSFIKIKITPKKELFAMSEEVIPPSSSKNELSTGIRVLLRILSVVLCLCLCASVTATALILDFRLVTSKDTMHKIAGSLVGTLSQYRTIPLTAAMGGLRMATPADANAQTQQELVSWLYNTLKEQHGEELLVTQEQMQTFVEQSTTKDYLTEKIASYMDDFVNGTDTTTITTEELNWLMDENNAAIETELDVKLDDAAREQVLSFAEEMQIGEVIRKEVIEKVENITISGEAPTHPGETPAGFTVGDLMAQLRALTSTTALIISVAVNILLIVALFFTNRMRLSGTLCCAGIPMTIMGSLLALATFALQLLPRLLPESIASALSVVTRTVAPVHYTILGLGIAALIGAITAKALRKK
jgi:hypothetical protein